jgi:single-strand DNA-binding protein
MLNHITLMGRLTRDPELRHTGNGTAVASFSLAVERDFRDKTSGQRVTDFIDVVAWRQTGEFVSKYFQKGRMAVVEGRLQMRDWQDRDGNKRRSAEVVAENVYFGDSRRDNDNGGYVPASSNYAPPASQSYESQSNYGAQNSYGSQNNVYGSPAPASDFTELSDDDGELPF